jgi:hypothetical protein
MKKCNSNAHSAELLSQRVSSTYSSLEAKVRPLVLARYVGSIDMERQVTSLFLGDTKIASWHVATRAGRRREVF